MAKSTFINNVLPILVMALLGALLGLCWRDHAFGLIAAPIGLALLGFSTDYGYRGHDASVAAKSALRVAAILLPVGLILFAIVKLG